MNEREDLKAYLDRELPPHRMAEIADAIKRDPELAREAEGLSQLSAAIRASEVDIPVMGMEATLKALEQKSNRPKWAIQIPVFVATAAALYALWIPLRSSAPPSQGAVAMKEAAAIPSSVGEAKAAAKRVTSRSRSLSSANSPSFEMRTKSATVNKGPAIRTEAAKTSKPDKSEKVTPRPPELAPVPAAAGAPAMAAPPGVDAQYDRVTVIVESPMVVEVVATDLVAAQLAVARLVTDLGGELVPEKAEAKSVAAESTPTDAKDRKLNIELSEAMVATFQKRVAEVTRELPVNQSQMFAAQANQSQGLPSQMAGRGAQTRDAKNSGDIEATKAYGALGGGGMNRTQRLKSEPDRVAKTPKMRVLVIIRLKEDKPIKP